MAFLASNYWWYWEEELFADSMSYWEYGQRFFLEDGSFSFLNYGAPLRGYLFPLVMGGISALSSMIFIDGLSLFRILSAVFFGTLATALAPAAYHKATGREAGTLQILVFSGLVLVFWRGYAAYPLTDFPAVACLLLGYVLFPVNEEMRGMDCLRTILAGFCLASAAIVRPSYLVVLLLLASYVVLKSAWRPRSISQRSVTRLTLLLTGIAVAFAPQMLLNAVHKGLYSAFPPSEGLYAQQLTWGIWMQRYDTNFSDTYPDPRMRFIDPVGDAVCKIEKIDGNRPLSYSEYASLVARYPMELATIYGRHLFNGLDLTYSTPYVKNVQKRSIAFSLANYFLIFAAIVILVESRSAWSRNWAALGFCLALISPAILSLPGAVETRFFLPIHLLVYAVVSFGLSTGDLWGKRGISLLRKYWLLALVCILFSFVLSSLTFSTLEHASVLLSVS